MSKIEINKGNILKLASLIAVYETWKKHDLPTFSRIVKYIEKNNLLKLSEDDLKELQSKKQVSWINLIQSERKDLVSNNYIFKTGTKSDEGNGIWLLTDPGKKYFLSLCRAITYSEHSISNENRSTQVLIDKAKQILIENQMIEKIQSEFKLDENLHFTEDENEILENQINSAIKMGKHIILIGPPGTGKSKIAQQICKHFTYDYNMVTASYNWSSYEIIGGYKINKDKEMYFDEGILLKSIKDSDNKCIRNKWIIIDELNRADIDKAFGSLFSVLAGDEVILSYEKEGKNIVIRPQGKDEIIDRIENHEYIIPHGWKLVATMNSYDKASLYEMSYAFMRRFAFIAVKIPQKIDVATIKKFLDVWNIDDDSIGGIYISDVILHIWRCINKIRGIGPAIIRDIASYANISNGDYTSSINMFVIPQLEGVQEREVKLFLDSLTKDSKYKNVFDIEKIEEFIETFLGIVIEKDGGNIHGDNNSRTIN